LLLEVELAGVARGRQAETLAGQLRAAVRVGTLPVGTRLPASRTLAADLGVSRGVVVRAYDQLVAEGYLAGRRGSGTIVAGGSDPGPPAPLRPITRSSNPGLPSGGTFPRAAWARCAARALAALTDDELGYGDPAGLPRLREELARYLGRVRAVLAPPERVIVVNGFAQASRLVADVLCGGGTTSIAVEDPGSIGLRDQLTASGLTCVPVPVDGEGIQVDALAASGVHAVVVTPAHQFPTGAVTSPARRHALLEWARSCGGLVLEDDYDAEFRYDRTARCRASDPTSSSTGAASPRRSPRACGSDGSSSPNTWWRRTGTRSTPPTSPVACSTRPRLPSCWRPARWTATSAAWPWSTGTDATTSSRPSPHRSPTGT
jgi:GntR family transcriptional regulator/MocR family aminotransferase